MERTIAAGRGLVGFLGGMALVLGSASASAEVSISQVPLFVSTSVKPNVMLQFDNSGSMANIIWDQRYDPGTDYPSPSRSYQMLSSGDTNYWCYDNRYSACIGLPSPRGTSTRYADNYLDWLVQEYGPGTDLRGGEIPERSRLGVAKQVATRIVADNRNVNFGLARFNPPFYYRCGRYWCSNGGEGGSIVAACGSAETDILDAIDGLGPDTNTPLAETFYEITRYFRGMERHYGSGSGSYTSPVEYSCQRNFVVTITDGLPTWDNLDIDNADDGDLPGAGGETLPDWDGLNPQTTGSPFPPYSDGMGGSISDEGSTLYLDDLAKFGYELDLREDEGFEGDEYDPQRLETYTVGFTIDNQMLEDAAGYGNGEYFTANNLEELTAALQGALSSIADKTSTAASLAASSTEASGDTAVFQATFSSGDWSGELSAYPYEQVGVGGQALWHASEQLPAPQNRTILSYAHGSGGVDFVWNDLDAAAKAALNDDPALLDYIRGDRTNEGGGAGEFRARGDGVLGDIVHSTPAFIGDQGYGYDTLPGGAGSAYRAHVLGKGAVPDIVLVGANDGMLHGFDAADGEELFAYVPRALYDALPRLADRGYGHRYYVDGSPAVADAYIDGGWHTIAVSSLGAGGAGAFALDVTAPESMSAADDVLWEVDPDNLEMLEGAGTPGDYLGAATGMPAIVRLESGDWVAIFGNGYNSAHGRAALLVLDLATGEVLAALDTGFGGDNGLAAPAAVDRDRNGSVDTVYAGDLKGNLWKFDLTASNRNQWGVAYSDGDGDPRPLFTAVDSSGHRQPITTRPDAMASPHGGLMLVFGTGKYLGIGDPTDDATQSVYGIWDLVGAKDRSGDPIDDTPVSNLSDLQRQAVIRQTSASGIDVRLLSDSSVDYEGDDRKRGWVFDLTYPGERINRHTTIADGKAILVSTVPNSDPCTFGGRSALIEINPLTGTQFDEPILDVNDDGEFDDQDGVVVTIDGEQRRLFPGLVDLDVGLATRPNILFRPDGDHEKQITGSNLNTQTIGEKGFFHPGRASWQQIR